VRRSKRLVVLAALAGTVGLAVVLRVVQLGHDSLWVDEAFSARIAESGWGSLFDQAPSADPNPPLYYAVLHLWIGLFGDSEAALRSLSAVVGVLLVLVVYVLGRKLGGTGVGLAAAFLSAVSEFFVHYSQEARVYSLLALLAAASYYFFLRLLDGPSTGAIVGYVLATTVLLYAHTYGLFVVAAQIGFALVALLWRRQWIPWVGRRAFVPTLAAPIVLTVPWFVVFAGHVSAEVRDSDEAKLSWLDAPTLHDIPGVLSGYAGSRWGLLVLAATFVATAFVAWRRSSAVEGAVQRALDDRNVVLLLFWLVVPIAVPFLISLAITPIYQFKYTIPAAVAFYLLVALGLNALGPRVALAATAAVGLGFFAATVRYYDNDAEDWRQAVAYISGRSHAGDTVVFDSSVGKTAFDYYWKDSDVSEVIGSDFAGLTDANLAAVRSATADSHAIWLVVSHSRDPKGEIPAVIAESHSQVGDVEFRGVRITRFE
jgi:mannosyltransferase